MAIYDDDQPSMAAGDEWYFDEFGEYRNANASQLEDEDIRGESIVPDETTNDKPAVEDEFNETLRSEHITDQLNDPNLQDEAESDYSY